MQRGFSGGPVWEQRTGQVIGLVQAIPSDEDSAAVYVVDTELLVQAWPELTHRPPPCPLHGGWPHSQSATDRFFGPRKKPSWTCSYKLRAPAEVIAIIGPSGSGKTSVLAAGLVRPSAVNTRQRAPDRDMPTRSPSPSTSRRWCCNCCGLPAPVPAAELDALARSVSSAGGLAVAG